MGPRLRDLPALINQTNPRCLPKDKFAVLKSSFFPNITFQSDCLDLQNGQGAGVRKEP